MNKCLSIFISLACGFFSTGIAAAGAASSVPDAFQGFDENSKLIIQYPDLDALLDAAVLNTGHSNREKANAMKARTGTRLTVDINRATVNEGNRFYFEVFDGNEENQQTLRNIRRSLESIPQSMPLENFTRDEQLAYWLNLYNVTILDELVKVYPRRDLEPLLVGEESILSKKTLTVAGIPLSLNDIQFTILRQNYDNDPLVIYGLFQGNIGSPNIRKSAYTGKHVYGDLLDNAVEFINSNRGTQGKGGDVFRVSSLYQRNRPFFPDFEADLTAHLLRYLKGQESNQLRLATEIKPDINDWTITDLFGSYRQPAGSIADNSAALMGSAANAGGSKFVGIQSYLSRYSPTVMKHLEELNQKRENNKVGSVTMEEVEQETGATEPAKQKDDLPD